MNYPVWDVAFGAGLLIALVSILHVFVSHLRLPRHRSLANGRSREEYV